jgi:hypothetical protein
MTMMKYPFNDSTNINIRILRKGPENNDRSRDDLIAIVEQENDVYDVYYHSADWKNEKTAHAIQVNGDDLDNYLYSLFFLLSRDADPFRSIQFNLPCMPSVLLDMRDLKKKGVREALTTIMPLLRSCLKVTF